MRRIVQMKKHFVVTIVMLLIATALVGGFLWLRNKEENTAAAGYQPVAEKEKEPVPTETVVQNTETEPTEAVAQDTEAPQEDVTMIFAGDMLFWTYVREQYPARGIGAVLSEEMQQEFLNADIAMVNEEFPFSTRGSKMQDKQYTFRVDPTYVSLFQDMGVDIVSLANNHILDYGQEALSDTFTTLDEAEIRYVGAGESLERAKEAQIFEVNGKRIAILSASRVIPVVGWDAQNAVPGVFTTYDGTMLCEEIRKAKEICDYVVTYVHWGVEYKDTPEEYQRTLAKQYIDAGADLVLGAHSHCLQSIEFYNGKPVFYGLGNFCFDAEIAKTLAIKVTVGQDGKSVCTVIPAKASGGCTMKMEEAEGKDLYQYLEEISNGIAIDDAGIVTEQ